jgi:hypothetical protein
MRTDEEPVLDVKRPFGWGLVIVANDGPSDDWPVFPKGALFASSPSCLMIAVRHAQDIEDDSGIRSPSDAAPLFVVRVTCWIGGPPPTVSMTAPLDISAGRVSVGDADREDLFELDAGVWIAAVVTEPAHYPESVDIWLTKARR